MMNLNWCSCEQWCSLFSVPIQTITSWENIHNTEREKRYEIYLYHDPEMEIWFQRQCRVW